MWSWEAEKSKALRERRAAQRSANPTLRAGVAAILGESHALDDEVSSLYQKPPPTISQATWDVFRGLCMHNWRTDAPSTSPPSHKIATDAIINLHPALALEKLRNQKRERRETVRAVSDLRAVSEVAPQMMRVADLAREAATQLQAATHAREHDRGPLGDSPPAHRPTKCYSTTSGSASNDVEVNLFALTQMSFLGLPMEVVDTRHQTVQTWMRRYQPAAAMSATAVLPVILYRLQPPTAEAPLPTTAAAASVSTTALSLTALLPRPEIPPNVCRTPSAQVYATSVPSGTVPVDARRAGMATAAATTTTISALVHTPTSAYLHSVLLREQDWPLGLPAYFVPRGRKELLTALVLRLPPASAAWRGSPMRQARPCTRLLLLNRYALSDREVQQVCQHWVDEAHSTGEAARAEEPQRVGATARCG